MTLKKLIQILLVIIFFQVLFFCKKDEGNKNVNDEVNNDFYLGADLSYVNEMEDCGAIYKNLNNLETDVFQIFESAGANLIRVRLWHNPTWTNYSNLEDVIKTIQRVKDNNMSVLLDFHYSDTWASSNNCLV